MRTRAAYIFSFLLLAGLFVACMLTGAVQLPASDVFGSLLGSGSDPITEAIVMESRLPMALAALLCGMGLSVAGLMLQTTFSNPLAGPSILGVSTGASLGVALVMLGSVSIFGSTAMTGTAGDLSTIIGALVGAGAIILILIAFSSAVKSAAMLLIAGIMIGYLAGAVVSWLNFFAPAQEVKNFAVWGMGSFMGVTIGRIPLFAVIVLILCLGSILMAKPLNALLAGDRYAASLGYNPRRTRTLILFYSGALTAVCTAYCGPVGFIGLSVPHITRLLFRTSHHNILLPSTIVLGGATGLLCAWLCVLPASRGVLPLSAVTPVIGIPIIIYVILRRKHLFYYQ